MKTVHPRGNRSSKVLRLEKRESKAFISCMKNEGGNHPLIKYLPLKSQTGLLRSKSEINGAYFQVSEHKTATYINYVWQYRTAYSSLLTPQERY